LGLGGILRFLGAPAIDTPKRIFELGRVEVYLDQPQTLVPAASAMILNAGDQLHAISTVCPHLGCQVNATAEGFTCPCHGSEFDPAGRRISGRAQQDLPTLQLEQTSEGNLILYK
jgi:cytochrome b6-f complex iron-sulfur subunit